MTRRSPSLVDKSALTPAQFEGNLASIYARLAAGLPRLPSPNPPIPELSEQLITCQRPEER